jgi:RimJ/RimL family protein N-acetyltransferase
MATVITSARLTLRHLGMADANFILDLLNQETFIRYIGDKGVRNLADAWDYLANGPVESYRRFGFGLYLASLKDGDIPIGICGLVKRESLEDVDVGFAFLPQYCGRGLATESAAAVLAYGHEVLGLKRIVGITAAENHASIAVLQKIGLRFERVVRLRDDGGEVKLFGPVPAQPDPKVREP